MVLSTGLGAVWPRPHRLLALMNSASSVILSRSSMVPLPEVILSSSSNRRLVPTRQGVHLPQDSSTVNSRKNLAMSTMQVSSSMTMRPPEPIMLPMAMRLS